MIPDSYTGGKLVQVGMVDMLGGGKEFGPNLTLNRCFWYFSRIFKVCLNYFSHFAVYGKGVYSFLIGYKEASPKDQDS